MIVSVSVGVQFGRALTALELFPGYPVNVSPHISVHTGSSGTLGTVGGPVFRGFVGHHVSPLIVCGDLVLEQGGLSVVVLVHAAGSRVCVGL